MPNPIVYRRVISRRLFDNLNPYVSAFVTRVNAEGGSVTANEISYLNTFANSVDLSEFDRLWIHGLSNQVAARVSLVNAATADLITEVNAPTWTANEGYTGNGTTMYLDLNYDPSVDAVKYALNSVGFGAYSRSDTTGSFVDVGLAGSGRITAYFSRAAGNLAYPYVNDDGTGALGVSNGNSLRLFHIRKTNATQASIYRDGSLVGTDVSLTTNIPTGNFYGLARNTNGTATLFSNRQLSMIFFGSGNIDPLTFSSYVQQLGTSLGWAV